jgi:hypothetical protein
MRQRLICDVQEHTAAEQTERRDEDTSPLDGRHEKRPAGRRHHDAGGKSHQGVHKPSRNRSKKEDWQRTDGGQQIRSDGGHQRLNNWPRLAEGFDHLRSATRLQPRAPARSGRRHIGAPSL